MSAIWSLRWWLLLLLTLLTAMVLLVITRNPGDHQAVPCWSKQFYYHYQPCYDAPFPKGYQQFHD